MWCLENSDNHGVQMLAFSNGSHEPVGRLDTDAAAAIDPPFEVRASN